MVATDRLRGLAQASAIKSPCRVATTANITLSGLQLIDGVANLAAGDRVLVWQQTDAVENGIYVAATGDWTRDVDCDGAGEILQGTIVAVTQGTLYTETIFQQTAANPLVIGTSELDFSATGAAALAVASAYFRNTLFPLTTGASILSALGGLSATAANTPAGNMTPSAGTWNLTSATVTVATAAAGDNDTSASSTAFVHNSIGGAVIRSYLAGLTTSNNAGTPNTKIDVTAGVCADSTNAQMLVVSAGTIDCSTTGANALDTGALANSTTYHVFAIGKTDGTTALIASTSATTPSPMPTGYTLKRRIGSVKTDGSAHIRAYVQDGSAFQWLVPNTTPYNSGANPGTGALTAAVDVPGGIRVRANLQINTANVSTGGVAYTLVSDLSTTDTAAAATLSDLTAALNGVAASIKDVWTNTSAQVRARLSFSDANVTLRIMSLGWTDSRGKDS